MKQGFNSIFFEEYKFLTFFCGNHWKNNTIFYRMDEMRLFCFSNLHNRNTNNYENGNGFHMFGECVDDELKTYFFVEFRNESLPRILPSSIRGILFTEDLIRIETVSRFIECWINKWVKRILSRITILYAYACSAIIQTQKNIKTEKQFFVFKIKKKSCFHQRDSLRIRDLLCYFNL